MREVNGEMCADPFPPMIDHLLLIDLLALFRLTRSLFVLCSEIVKFAKTFDDLQAFFLPPTEAGIGLPFVGRSSLRDVHLILKAR